MTIQLIDRPRPSRKVLAVFVLLLLVVLCTGVLAGRLGAVPAALAVCGVASPCPGQDVTKTAILTVNHAYDPESTNVAVEPNDGDTLTITPYWATIWQTGWETCDCQEVSASVSVDVTWSEANHAWSTSCTGCDSVNGPIYGVGVCLAGSYCGGMQVDNSAAYKLYVDVAQQNQYYCIDAGGSLPAHLDRVAFSTTVVDDGNLVNLQACSEGSSVSPTSQSWSQTDYGPLECTYDCNQSGPSVTIEYE